MNVGSSSRGLQRNPANAVLKLICSGEIDSMKSLIDTLNNETGEAELNALRDVVRQCIDCFSQLEKTSIVNLRDEDLQECLVFGQIKVRSPLDKQLLQSWFSSLCNAILQGRHGEERIVAALEGALLCIDHSVFDENPAQLVYLANTLLSKLDPTKTPFTIGTYGIHVNTLSALYQTFAMLQKVDPAILNPTFENGVYQAFKAHLEKIKEAQSFYPFVYHVMVIEQSIQRLECGDNVWTWTGALSRFACGAWGALCLIQGIRQAIELNFENSAFEAGAARLREAFRTIRIEERSWYQFLGPLIQTADQVVKDPTLYNVFEEGFDELVQNQNILVKNEDRIAVRFGMIDQLVTIILQTPDDAVRCKAITRLTGLVRNPKAGVWKRKTVRTLLGGAERPVCKGWSCVPCVFHCLGSTKLSNAGEWIEDDEISQALIIALNCVKEHVGHNPEVEDALELLASVIDPNLQERLRNWTERQSINERHASLHQPAGASAPHRIFHMVKETAEAAVTEEDHDYDLELRAHYKSDDFAQVDALFDNERARHVESLKYNLVRYEDTEQERQSQEKDHSVSGHSRKNLVRKSLELNELFERRSLEPSGQSEDVKKVRVVGNPGTGKTSISKKLANMWATGSWGTEFNSVYFVAVRELTMTLYDGNSLRAAQTLANAIAKLRFGWKDDNEYIALRDHISDELGKSTTLLILDGLDERAGACQKIVNEALGCSCKLLLLSRPYNLHRERELFDLEAECLGLSDDQLIEFIEAELPSDNASQLTSFLKSNSGIWDLAHVPVMANILSVFWRSGGDEFISLSTQNSICMLYTQLSQYIWKRHVEKNDFRDANREEEFQALGRIAFEALSRGQILIDQRLVEHYSSTYRSGINLKTSGLLLLKLEGCHYQFPHLTFQEYFAGRHIAAVLCEGGPEEKTRMENFVSQNKYKAEFGVMLRFMMEEVRRINGIEGVNRVMTIIDKEPSEVISLQHLLLRLTLLKAAFSITLNESELNETHQEDECKLQQMTELIMAASESGCEDICRSIIDHIPSLATVMPHRAKEYVQLCINLLQDDNSHGRQAAAEATPDGMRFSSDNSDELAQLLVNSLLHISPEVPFSVKAILEQMGYSPNHSEKLAKLLVTSLQDVNTNVYQAAVEAIPEVMRQSPNNLGEVVNLFPNIDSSFVLLAFRTLVGKVYRLPDHSEKLAKLLVTSLQDVNPNVYQAAVEAIPEVLGRHRHLRDDYSGKLAKLLVTSLQDVNPNIHQSAVEAIPVVMRLSLDHSGEMARLVNSLQDVNPNVHQAAVEAILGVMRASSFFEEPSSVVRVCIPFLGVFVLYELPRLSWIWEHRSDELAQFLVNSLKDVDACVRRAAFKAILEVMRLSPNHLNELAQLLVNLLRDGCPQILYVTERVILTILNILSDGARHNLLDQLAFKPNDDKLDLGTWDRVIPTEYDVCIYWESQKTKLIPGLAERFLNISVVIFSDDQEPGLERLVLQDTSSTEWKRPASEIERFVSLIRDKIKQTLLGLSKILGTNGTDSHKEFANFITSPS